MTKIIPKNCPRCPRLVQYRCDNRAAFADWYNGAVPSFGSLDARYLVVGLAPGLRGANRTGRPFTGDYAGDLLYATLQRLGLAQGIYDRQPDDGLKLVNTRITNAVRCVPPANKPLPQEFHSCLPFLADEIAAMPHLTDLFAVGRDAHQAILSALDLRKSAFVFGHGKQHQLTTRLRLTDSYHCSRYNTNTGRLTEQMFHDAMTAMLQ